MDNPCGPRTSDRADAFVRRDSLWLRLKDLFVRQRPTERQLGQVSTIAEVSIDKVFSAYKLSEEQCLERHPLVKDFAECAALYGYMLGRAEGLLEGEAQGATVARLLASLPSED